MVIEQSIMKTDEGVARGESFISKQVYGMLTMNTVFEELKDLSNVEMDTTDQHVDASDSREKRDFEEINKLVEWFLSSDPFPVIQKNMLIASGVVGGNPINFRKARAYLEHLFLSFNTCIVCIVKFKCDWTMNWTQKNSFGN